MDSKWIPRIVGLVFIVVTFLIGFAMYKMMTYQPEFETFVMNYSTQDRVVKIDSNFYYYNSKLQSLTPIDSLMNDTLTVIK